MDGSQRLSDIWSCDLRTLQWQQIQQHGIAPLGRSLHSASLIQNKMYIFGGWVPVHGEEIGTSDEASKTQWKCSNDLCCFDLKTQKWETFAESLCENLEQMPKPRAGHCAGN
jgi:host cell factor